MVGAKSFQKVQRNLELAYFSYGLNYAVPENTAHSTLSVKEFKL
jgi:hypothetical protein